MMDSDQVKVVADIKLQNSEILQESVQILKKVSEEVVGLSQWLRRIETPVTWTCYFLGVSALFWSSSLLIDSINRWYRPSIKKD